MGKKGEKHITLTLEEKYMTVKQFEANSMQKIKDLQEWIIKKFKKTINVSTLGKLIKKSRKL